MLAVFERIIIDIAHFGLAFAELSDLAVIARKSLCISDYLFFSGFRKRIDLFHIRQIVSHKTVLVSEKFNLSRALFHLVEAVHKIPASLLWIGKVYKYPVGVIKIFPSVISIIFFKKRK